MMFGWFRAEAAFASCKTPPALRVSNRLGRQHFDRHGAVQARIQRPVDHTHPPLAELFLYEVMRQGSTNHWIQEYYNRNWARCFTGARFCPPRGDAYGHLLHGSVLDPPLVV